VRIWLFFIAREEVIDSVLLSVSVTSVGGGKRVLWAAIQYMQVNKPDLVNVIQEMWTLVKSRS
jgi:hypothetical protein